MSIIGWIILGLIAGFIGSKIVNKSGEGLICSTSCSASSVRRGRRLPVLAGRRGSPVTGLNIYSLIVAVIGAVVVLFIYHAIVGRRAV